MCEPATIMMGVGLAMSAVGAAQQSSAQKEQAEYQSKVANNNRILAEREATQAVKSGEDAASLHKLQSEQLASRQIVSLAGQGVDISEGSSVDLLADTAELAEFDAAVIRGNAAREAYNLRVQAANFAGQSDLYSATAANESPLFAGTSTLLSGAGLVASKWYKPKTQTGKLATAPNGQTRGFANGMFGGGV